MSRLLTHIANSPLRPSVVVIALRDLSSSSIRLAANQGPSRPPSPPTSNQEPSSNASNSTTPPPARPVTSLFFSDDSPEESKVTTTPPTTTSEPWTGDERVEDTVLRMLIDKYNKPLRVEGAAIRAIPKPAADYPQFILDQLVTQKPVAKSSDGPEEEVSSAVKARERAARARTRLQDRVTGARDKALDYKLKKDWPEPEPATTTKNLGSATTTVPITDGEITPQMIMQYRHLVDVRIEAARARGDFNNLPGRGKPLPYDHHSQNPFLDTSEYLMNRLVQRQGGVPPWIEMQGEVDREVQIFRRVLGDGWRRVIICGENGESKRVRKEWEQAQQAYVNAAVQRLNNRIRSFNIICPMNVQRPFMSVEKEFRMVYEVGDRYEQSESETKKNEKEIGTSRKTNEGEKKEERAKTRIGSLWTSLFGGEKNLG